MNMTQLAKLTGWGDLVQLHSTEMFLLRNIVLPCQSIACSDSIESLLFSTCLKFTSQ